MNIRIGILGYGNLGRGVECAVRQNPDMELKAVFTRRNPEQVKILTEGAAVCRAEEAEAWKDKLDVVILCGGSATDLPVQTPEYARLFNVVDSFDTHARIPEHFANVDASAKEGGNARHYFCWMGPGNVLIKSYVCQRYFAGRQGLYFLGTGRQPGTFRCHPAGLRGLRMRSNIRFL